MLTSRTPCSFTSYMADRHWSVWFSARVQGYHLGIICHGLVPIFRVLNVEPLGSKPWLNRGAYSCRLEGAVVVQRAVVSAGLHHEFLGCGIPPWSLCSWHVSSSWEKREAGERSGLDMTYQRQRRLVVASRVCGSGEPPVEKHGFVIEERSRGPLTPREQEQQEYDLVPRSNTQVGAQGYVCVLP